MIKFSEEVPKCIEQWAQVAVNCKGDPKCINIAGKQFYVEARTRINDSLQNYLT